MASNPYFGAIAGYSNLCDEERRRNDYYPTPPIATYCLLRSVRVPKSVWEPAAGRGHVSAELVRNGHSVVSSDLYEYENPSVMIRTGVDFLASDVPAVSDDGSRIEAIVTNPPYDREMAEKFARKALELRVPFVAMLARLQFLTGKKRYKRLFSESPPTDVLIMTRRIRCFDENINDDPMDQLGGMIEYAWYVWDRRKQSTETALKWIDVDRFVAEMIDDQRPTLEGIA